MRRGAQRAGALFSVVVMSIGLDQLSKRWATITLATKLPESFLGGTVRLEYARNAGAFLGLGANLPPATRFWLLNVGVLIAMLALLLVVLFAERISTGRRLAYALMISGGLSNAWDRFSQEGRVTDFLNLGIGNLRTGIFNVADLVLVMGVLLLLIPGRKPPRVSPSVRIP